MSPTSFVVGTGLSKSRRTRSSLLGAPSSGTVVVLEALGQIPRMPSSDMHFLTR